MVKAVVFVKKVVFVKTTLMTKTTLFFKSFGFHGRATEWRYAISCAPSRVSTDLAGVGSQSGSHLCCGPYCGHCSGWGLRDLGESDEILDVQSAMHPEASAGRHVAVHYD